MKKFLSLLLVFAMLLPNLTVFAAAETTDSASDALLVSETEAPVTTAAAASIPEESVPASADTTEVSIPADTASAEETTAAAEATEEAVPEEALTNEAEMAGATTFSAFQTAIRAAINAGADENGNWEYRQTQPITITGNQTLDITLPDGFGLYFVGSTLTVAKGATLTLKTGIEFQFATFDIKGTLNIQQGAGVSINNNSTMNVTGVVNNYGALHVGLAWYAWDGAQVPTPTVGQLNILSGGTMNNYFYLSVLPYDAVYNDKGELDHTTGGYVSLEGTLYAHHTESQDSFIQVGGIMDLSGGGKLLVPSYSGQVLGNFDVTGQLNTKGGDVSQVPKSYIAVHPEEGGKVSGMENDRLKACFNAHSDEELLAFLTGGSHGYHSTHLNSHGDRTLYQDVQIDPNMRFSMSVQPIFDDKGNITGGSLTLADGVDLCMNNSMLYVNSKLILSPSSDPENNPTMLQLNDGTVAEVRGTLENHGSILVGIWNDHNKECTSGLVVMEGGTLENYGYISAYGFEDMYENGTQYGRSGGFFHIYGTLNTRTDSHSTSFIEVGGEMSFKSSATFGCYDEWTDPMLCLLPDGVLWLDNGFDANSIPEGYMARQARPPISVAEFKKQLKSAIDAGETYFEVNQSLVVDESLTLTLPDNFDVNFCRPVQVNKGKTLKFDGGMVEFNESALIVDGTLRIQKDTRLFLNCVSYLEVNGTMTNYGEIEIGAWVWADSESPAGEILVSKGGTLNNYNYIHVRPLMEVPTDNGGDPGKSWGSLVVKGTVKVGSNGHIEVGGDMTVEKSGVVSVSKLDKGVGVSVEPSGHLENKGKCTGDVFWAMGEVKITNRSSDGAIKVSWDEVRDAKSYQVYRATSKKGTYKLMKTTTGTSYTNTTATAGKTYYYKVRAVLADDSVEKYSDWSDIKSRTRDLAQPSITLSGVSSSGKIKVSWKAIDGAEKYEVYRATSKTGKYTKMTTTSKTSYTNTSAKAGTTYYYKVKAIHENSAANSAYSSYKSRTCDLPRPDVEISLKSGDPRLTWDKVSDAKEYKIYRATSKNGSYKWVKTTTGTSYTNTAVTAGKTYYYKVMAVHSKSAANSAYSSVVSIKAK